MNRKPKQNENYGKRNRFLRPSWFLLVLNSFADFQCTMSMWKQFGIRLNFFGSYTSDTHNCLFPKTTVLVSLTTWFYINNQCDPFSHTCLRLSLCVIDTPPVLKCGCIQGQLYCFCERKLYPHPPPPPCTEKVVPLQYILGSVISMQLIMGS